ncbi:RPP0 [Nakaseomyces glabratus]|uniref:60S acidic ribosomal protein P0 n=2 Tax=Candida glabrata TaxID=5478 RepID=Q6FTP0_CANGA|nr:60S acidic ribosomal protein P0 [Nakaseomyces glabratus]KAH7586707.1 60s Acidic ribosomal protein [Nakaseomyces glabratus]KAH7588707.1 60s Acidic ribosomal protein [Nakaseomyces glabratus]KAH7593121.1 60s Acidic ribosomal protein [Nakaseomyces glabratus]KAH7602157.1 60s Acidic ribosomal protein [Nakaseomyces glabratus]KAH7603157.1 60s Acidic ribosomal protein [Nakaseomyces glabratus]|eukprot:XP_446404.1 60S acidic ribosomal protein P0 [[Candida] glabrata]
MGGIREKKAEYFAKLREYLEEYKSIFVVGVDNVSSQQMHQVRKALRGRGVVLMGKNTMVRRAIRGFISDLPDYEKLLPFIKGNVGFIFTNESLKDIKEVIVANKVAAPARSGAVAPEDIWVKAMNTGMEPGKTSFFQALGVPTKIARGTIEIVSDVKVVEAGNRVGPSEASLLNLLNISPFTYGLTVVQVYDQGQVFPSTILDITDEELVSHFVSAVTTVAAISLAAGYPTLPSVGHTLINNYKNLLAVAIASSYHYPEIEELIDRIENPENYASAAPAAAAASGDAAPAEEAAAEEEDESDDDMGFGLFD